MTGRFTTFIYIFPLSVEQSLKIQSAEGATGERSIEKGRFVHNTNRRPLPNNHLNEPDLRRIEAPAVEVLQKHRLCS
jgi:hypothetical protein